ncbi:LysR family transcriptional regulator [Sphingobium nicotianae]|uniref:LysR family transcriptional regulator n=1 Tax=Sphingobium nicotianae TaxID=2782607 RepID=A0A9X1DDM9_9SPHN|nr:LysR family transcriptional regulator [Sphingobium nicotianae]MBT2188252.1 LysR family transcriptional regulator [Sphingobium nicotianae]
MADEVTFVQLRTFAIAARAGSFAQAAEQLVISQPSVSEQIMMLEQRLGYRLFRRRRGTTPVLTTEGVAALEEIDTILKSRNNLSDIGRKPAAKILLRISVGRYIRENYLRQVFSRLFREYPDVEIDLQPLFPPAEITRLLEDGELEMAIYGESVADELQPYSRIICETSTVAIAPPGTQARVAAGECSLDDFQFICPGRRDLAARNAKQCLRELGLTPRLPTMFVDFVDALAQLVEDGKGIGVAIGYAVADRIAAGRVEALDIPLLPHRRLIARGPHAPKVARAIEDILCEELAV